MHAAKNQRLSFASISAEGNKIQKWRVLGLVLGGHFKQAENYINRYQIEWDLEGLDLWYQMNIRILNENHLNNLIKFNNLHVKGIAEDDLFKPKILKVFYLKLCIDAGYFNVAIQHCKNHQNPSYEKILIALLSEHHLLETNSTILHQFSFIKDHAFLNKIAIAHRDNVCLMPPRDPNLGIEVVLGFPDEFDRLVSDHLGVNFVVNPNMPSIVLQAIKINKMMYQYNFGYDEALAFTNESLRNLFILLPLCKDNWSFTPDILSVIVSWLAPNLDKVKSSRMLNDFHLIKHKQLLSSDIHAYRRQPKAFHKTWSKNFLIEANATCNLKDYTALLGNKYSFFYEGKKNNPDNNLKVKKSHVKMDEFPKIIERRFKSL